MKTFCLSLLFIISFSSFGGGEYGGGPKMIALYKQDFKVGLYDMKLTRDKEQVELHVGYYKKRTKYDPFLSEKESNKLKFGKFTYVRLKYDAEEFSEDVIDKLKTRRRLFPKKSRFKELAKENFTIEEVTDQVNATEDTRVYEVQRK